MTWLDCGNVVRRADVVLSLERMNRVMEYSPADLTATVEAGLTLNELNAITKGEKQWLPLDPPGSSIASVGAIAACNSSGALRFGYGMPRDYVLGLRLAHSDGSESKSGGRVVKNVAGYDLNKLYVGSYGTLAVLTEMTVKLRPLPESAATVLISSKYRGHLFLLAKKLMASELLPVSVIITNHVSGEGEPSGSGDNAMLVRFMESELAVKHQVDCIVGALDENLEAALLSEAEAGPLWTRVAEWHQLRPVVLRISVPLSELPKKFEEALQTPYGCVAVADVGTGIIRMAFDGDDDFAAKIINRLRDIMSRVGGSVVIERASVQVKRQVDAWGDVGPAAKLMQLMKAKFDPQSVLNPGRFVAGI
jgi:glycolate oxidase FAD binding subunit